MGIKIGRFIARWMGALVLLVAALALIWPAPFLHVGTWSITPMLGLIMFGMGMTIKLSDFRIILSRPKDMLIGCLAQFTIMPLLAWSFSQAFNLPSALAIGVILVGCCPGGTASNVITYLAHGDLALSVGMTSVSTILAPLLTPFLTWLLAGETVDVDALGMLLSILYVVVLPIVAGSIIQHYLPSFTQKAAIWLPAFSTLMITAVVAIIVAHNAEKLLTSGLLILAVVMLHNLCGFVLGYTLGRLMHLTEPKRRAISIEVGMQNSGLATSLATIHFAAYPLAAVPGAIFSVWHNISGALFARWFARKDS